LGFVTDFVFIYGPPAAGKYTIAKALAEQLNWPLFHNHIVIDCVSALLKRGESGFLDACADVRLALTRHALANGKPMVSTFVYAREVDDALVERIRSAVARANARFCAVQLRCARESLMLRCQAPHRAPMAKISTTDVLQTVLREYDCWAPIPVAESLAIDTDQSTVAQSVLTIRERFAL
jgi:predicted kinase